MLSNIRNKVKKRLAGSLNANLEKRIEFLESKIQLLNKMVYDVYPESFQFNEYMKQDLIASGLLGEMGKKVNMTISKNDIMFLYNLKLYKNDFRAAYVEYFNSGYHLFNFSDTLIKSIFGDKEIAILDFASGHGRLTRFLAEGYNPKNIWASDTKRDAVDFQSAHFGINGFYSYFNPDELKVDQKFDFIFVASLFSHLDEGLFKLWLKKLIDMLSPEGVVAFSTVDAGLYTPNPQIDFHYMKYPDYVLQEEIYEFKDSQQKGNCSDVYGVTFISNAKLMGMLRSMNINDNQVTRFSKGLWDLQDLYVVSKKAIDLSKVKFEKYQYFKA